MKIGRRPGRTVLALACATLLAPASAQAAQHVVDDDKLECPSAGFTSISAAVAAAAAGDTISICDGEYYEGTGEAGSSSLTARLKKGVRYTFWCGVSDHAAEGMKGSFVAR